MIVLEGKAININKPIVGVITKSAVPYFYRKNKILILNEDNEYGFGYSCCLSQKKPQVNSSLVHSIEEIGALNEGDIVLVTPGGRIAIMYSGGSEDFTLFVTNRCNSSCIMCPQPPSSDPPDLNEINLKVMSLIKPGAIKHIGITGGEPTVTLDHLTECLKVIRNGFPEAFISLLTNARKFQDINIVREIASAKNKKLLYCVPLYADNNDQHDNIVGVANAFNETIQGILNLYRLRQRIEIRIVVMEQNYQRLSNLAEFIYRNLPFVSHVAFMGMEYTGEAEKNIENLWIDPTEYMEELYKAVYHLNRRGLFVSIYNLPLCLLPKSLWKFSRDSISTWKKAFLEQCDQCKQKHKCGGVFQTSLRQSRHLVPLGN